MKSAYIVGACLAAQTAALSIVVYEFANCTGKQDKAFVFTTNTCTPLFGTFSSGMTTCSAGKATFAFYQSPDCSLPILDALYEINTGDPTACIPAPAMLAMSGEASRGMRITSSACTLETIQGALYAPTDTTCTSFASLIGLVPVPVAGASTCFNPFPSTKLTLSMGGYTPSASPPRFNTLTMYYDEDTPDGSSACNSGGGAMEYGSASNVNRDACATLQTSGMSLFNAKWSQPATYDPTAPGIVPAGIPTASLSPIKCWEGNKTTFSLQTQAQEGNNLCMSGSFMCQANLPEGTEDVCSQADINARTKFPFRASINSQSWSVYSTFQAVPCTVPIQQGGCPLYTDLSFCATEGCNTPPPAPSSGAVKAQAGMVMVTAAAAAAVLLARRDV